MNQKEQANQLRVLWKSARDKYHSFFTVLSEVRKEIGDEELPKWCLIELHIGLSMITQVAGILHKVDEARVKEELKAATKAENEHKAAEAAKKRQEKEQSELAHEEHKKKLAELTLQRVRAEAEKEKAEALEKRRKQKQNNPDERGAKATAKRRKREVVSGLSDAELKELVHRFKKADKQCEKGIANWIEGSIGKAIVLAAARGRFKADQAFSDWLEQNGIKLEKNDRAALINLGNLGEKTLRGILEGTHSRSYAAIWRQHQALHVAAVSA